MVARREFRLRGIGENARLLGASHVLIIAADVVKEEDCRRFVNETVRTYGRGKSLKFCSLQEKYEHVSGCG